MLQSATSALDDQAAEAATNAEAIRTDASKALNAETQGFRPEVGVAPEEITDPVLDALSQRDLQIKSLKEGARVTFDLTEGNKGLMAANIRAENGPSTPESASENPNYLPPHE